MTFMVSPRCPFYGFRWPDRKMDLVQMGGNECGLDFDINGPCKMETCGLTPDARACQVAEFARAFLSVAENRMRFYPAPYTEGLSLRKWTDCVMTLR